jgi:hypothetical protein
LHILLIIYPRSIKLSFQSRVLYWVHFCMIESLQHDTSGWLHCVFSSTRGFKNFKTGQRQEFQLRGFKSVSNICSKCLCLYKTARGECFCVCAIRLISSDIKESPGYISSAYSEKVNRATKIQISQHRKAFGRSKQASRIFRGTRQGAHTKYLQLWPLEKSIAPHAQCAHVAALCPMWIGRKLNTH